MTGVLAPELTTVVPDRFRFSDENPLTLVAYGRSRYAELPGYAQDVVERDLGLGAAEWDRLVDEGEAYGVCGTRRQYGIGRWLAAQRRGRRGSAPGTVCGECWGTDVEFDPDGSLTGTVGRPVICHCAQPLIVRRPRVETRSRACAAGVPMTTGWPGAARQRGVGVVA